MGDITDITDITTPYKMVVITYTSITKMANITHMEIITDIITDIMTITTIIMPKKVILVMKLIHTGITDTNITDMVVITNIMVITDMTIIKDITDMTIIKDIMVIT